MVVVPTSHDVTLTYGLTKADWFGRIGTLVGLVLFALVVWRFPQVPLRWTVTGAPAPDAPEPDGPAPAPDAPEAQGSAPADGPRDTEPMSPGDGAPTAVV
jgi:hypothetical protein